MEWFTQTSGAPGGGGMGQMLIFMVPVFIIMYVLMIRPQKLKEKKRKEYDGHDSCFPPGEGIDLEYRSAGYGRFDQTGATESEVH